MKLQKYLSLINIWPEYIEYSTKYGFQYILGRARLSSTLAMNSRETSFHCSIFFYLTDTNHYKNLTGKCYLEDNSPSCWYNPEYKISGQRQVLRSCPVDKDSHLYSIYSTMIISYHNASYPWTVSLWSQCAPRH